MAIRKPGPGSTQAQINAYIRQELTKRKQAMGAEGPKRSPMKKTPAQMALSKVKPADRKKLMEKAKKSKPKPRLY